MFGSKQRQAEVESLKKALESLRSHVRDLGKELDRVREERASHVRELTDIQEQAQRLLNRTYQRQKKDRDEAAKAAENGEKTPQLQLNPLATRLLGRQ